MPPIPCDIDPMGSTGLPSGYKRLAAISCEGNGDSHRTHLIHTGYVPNRTTRWLTDLTLLPFSYGVPEFPYLLSVGTVVSSAPHSGFHFTLLGYDNFRLEWRLFGPAQRTTEILSEPNTRYVFDLDAPKQEIRINGKSFSAPYSATTAFGDLYLFGRNQKQTGVPSFGSNNMKLYRSRAWENDVLVHDWVPAQRLADGVNGLFDTCTGEFLKNYYTANFIPHYL